jgi:ketosteroid isomerase-like protein
MKCALPLFALLLLCAAPSAHPQTTAGGPTGPSVAPAQPTPAPAADETEIRAVIAAQVGAWNRGDIPAFMQAYEDSPSTTFIGLSLRKGFRPILERYQKSYTNAAQMGVLTFNDLAVRLLPGSCGQAEYAIVTGKFHLERKTRGEATKDDGIFSLVWHKGPHGWKIILDHTS